MVHGAVQFTLDVLAFFGDFDATHHASLQRFAELGVFEIFQHETTLVVPFAERAVQLLVFVGVLGRRALLAVPFGERAVDADGLEQLAVTVSVDVLEPTILEVEFPAAIFDAVEVGAFAQPLPAAVKCFERTVQGPLSVGHHLARKPVVVPSGPGPIELAVHVGGTLKDLS